MCSAVWLQAHAQFNVYITFLCSAIHNISLLETVAKKRVYASKVHQNYYSRVVCLIIRSIWCHTEGKAAPSGEKKVLFHHDNAPAYTSAIATAKLFDLRYEILPHLPYSPYLAPSDYFLFPNMKTWLEGKRFLSNEEIIATTNEYSEGFDKNYFLEGIKKLEYCYNKCIQFKEDYVET